MNAIMNMKMKFKKNQKGLTLVELLAVVVILGIISAIAVPAIGGIIQSTKDKADIATTEMVTEAALLYVTATATNTDTELTVPVATLESLGYLSKPASWNTEANEITSLEATLVNGVWGFVAS